MSRDRVRRSSCLPASPRNLDRCCSWGARVCHPALGLLLTHSITPWHTSVHWCATRVSLGFATLTNHAVARDSGRLLCPCLPGMVREGEELVDEAEAND